MRKIILYIASSADGFIAGPGHDLSFLDVADEAGSDFGHAEFVARVDEAFTGRTTYEVVAGLGYPDPHPEREFHVISTNQTQPPHIAVDLLEWARGRKNLTGRKDIWCDGGASIAQQLIDADLIDEIILTVMPQNLSSGTLLFKNATPPESFRLNKSLEFPLGIIQRHYLLHAP